ncbi:MAG: L-2-amino-thiazoline-4-carboxylic acid hydrolase, partial [Planctomycetota bacterium]|nr:L-2-amino-thiazoline-4-carboxylic acid hydrolase [Planctomycetota bacterium]
KILYKHLGLRGLLTLLPYFLWRSLFDDPIRKLPRKKLTKTERFSRHQFRPVLILYLVLKERLQMSEDHSLEILGDLVGQSGARFIQFNMASFDPKAWFKLDDAGRIAKADTILNRFFNMSAARVSVDKSIHAFGFDVTACHFAEMAQALECPEIARLYCVADSVYFEDPQSQIRLDRDKTLARGDHSCNFRFAIKDQSEAH